MAKVVVAFGLHRKSDPWQQRLSHLSYLIWRAMNIAWIPTLWEPVGLLRQDGKHYDGTTILLISEHVHSRLACCNQLLTPFSINVQFLRLRLCAV